jgi:UDP-hydrolysing UDP-N-acetyl-D-glucosamine 2-epimerase
MKKICVVTGSRAEYGLLTSTLRLIESSRDLSLQLVVTGAHLSPEFGNTVDEIVRDGFKISRRVKSLSVSRDAAAVGRSIGCGITGIADALKSLKPDIVMILGDRFEIFAAAAAAMSLNIPIAHISGGDVTRYSMDEQIRHAITKMSHIHFVSLEEHAARVKQMGEEPWRVHVVGEPCIDNIRNLKMMSRQQVGSLLGLDLFRRPLMLVTFHPVTLQPNQTSQQIKSLVRALSMFEGQKIFTYPNADTGGRTIISEMERFAKNRRDIKVFKSLGTELYLNILSHADVIIGNSSSALVEAPSFRLPAVNVGKRQHGRLAPGNVISVSGSTSSIVEGIKKALSGRFRSSIRGMKNPYDRGGAAKKMVNIISRLELGGSLLDKKFVEMPRR